MISTRILDNDMKGINGCGTVYGVAIELNMIVKDKDSEDVGISKKFSVTELDVGDLEILSADRGIPRFTEHAKQLGNPELEKYFVEEYRNWVGEE